jgi:hypothetical protein
MPKPDALFNDLGAPYIGQPPYHVTPKVAKDKKVPTSTWERLKQENEERKLNRSSVTVEQARRINREHGAVREVKTEKGRGGEEGKGKGKGCVVM